MTDPLNRIRQKLMPANFAWYGPRAIECAGLQQIVPLRAVLCCDDGQDVRQLARQVGATLVSVEQQTGRREAWNNFSLGKLFGSGLVEQVERHVQAQDLPVQVIAFATTTELAEFANVHAERVSVLGVRPSLKMRLDDKIYLRYNLSRLGLKILPGEVAGLATVDFNTLSAEYGLPLVVQLPLASSGNDTQLVANQREFLALQQRQPHSLAIISQHFDGLPLNVQVTILDDALVFSSPSMRLVGLPNCTPRPGVFCGDDFFAVQQLPKPTLGMIFEQSTRLAHWLKSQGYRGLCGLDFLWWQDSLYPVKINPCFQASTALSTQIELENNIVPLSVLHLLHFLNEPVGAEDVQRHAPFFSARPDAIYPGPVNAAQLWLYNRAAHDCTVRGKIRPGIYQLAGNTLQFVREGFSLAEVAAADEFAVTGGVPFPETVVAAGAPILQVQTRRPLLDVETQQLNTWAAAVCDRIYQQLDMQATTN